MNEKVKNSLRKNSIRQLFIIVPLMILFGWFSTHSQNLFYKNLNDWIELFRKHSAENGMTDSQIQTIATTMSSSAIATFSSLTSLYNITIIVLIAFIAILTSMLIGLQQDVKELKEKLNV